MTYLREIVAEARSKASVSRDISDAEIARHVGNAASEMLSGTVHDHAENWRDELVKRTVRRIMSGERI